MVGLTLPYRDGRHVIAVRYPDDQATGYALGHLRGAVSVRVALAKPANPH
jgi:hypothetical protein